MEKVVGDAVAVVADVELVVFDVLFDHLEVGVEVGLKVGIDVFKEKRTVLSVVDAVGWTEV